ncbi:mannose-6-phosphate isomerase [Violaceomyces palustris]|uniref:Mannose-6-phosphate isomerase n=1 Tax=Violaceomyces palustris TaxID=1673888 RepID=A0ACD0NTU6_9BASI|nr:mannose-6-phosphate isomerase [Violaceomyces palustris]
MPPDHGSVFQILPGVQSYDWGMKRSSRVATFAKATSQLDFDFQPDRPYAELWMGTHPSLPSRVIPPPWSSTATPSSSEFQPLSSYLASNPHLIGEKVLEKFSSQQGTNLSLPFLFKVLSVGKALSIQAHPDKRLGKELHEKRPEIYKDPNHKPEMAIALTPFSGFCGFRPLQEILGFLKRVPELERLVSLDQGTVEAAERAVERNEDKALRSSLKLIFGRLMRSKEEEYTLQAQSLVRRYSTDEGWRQEVDPEVRERVLSLNEQFPNDIGIFCTFLLNTVKLKPGEALFLGANEPHAYLEGEILECMAESDNVVRAGLTPKLRDVETLVEMLTYSSGDRVGRLQGEPPATWMVKSSERGGEDDDEDDAKTLMFDPPIEEFSVLVSRIRAGEHEDHEAIQGPSILLHLQGQGKIEFEDEGEKEEDEKGQSENRRREFQLDETKPGKVFFIGSSKPIRLVSSSLGGAELVVARAFVVV